jgi:hypothetical protein
MGACRLASSYVALPFGFEEVVARFTYVNPMTSSRTEIATMPVAAARKRLFCYSGTLREE